MNRSIEKRISALESGKTEDRYILVWRDEISEAEEKQILAEGGKVIRLKWLDETH